MVNAAETTSIKTKAPLSPILPKEVQETPSLTTPTELETLVPLRVGHYHFRIPLSFQNGYLAARKAYAEMEEQDECGAYLFLTGYEYAHLTRQYIPVYLSPKDKREWQRGFITGWTACSYGF